MKIDIMARHMASAAPKLILDNLSMVFETGEKNFTALAPVNMSFEAGRSIS